MKTLDEKSVIAALKQKIGIDKIDKNGYYISSNPKDNLLEEFPNWKDVRDELNEGAGNELTSKFCAVHSSSALCVNNFTPFKENFKKVDFLGYSDFSEAIFEKKQPTGLIGTPPHLDFYLENNNTIIGFESKFTEYFTQKLPNHDKNLEKYYNNNILSGYLPNGFNNEIIKYHICYPNKMHLDVAQLIKHTIGLLKNKNGKKAILVYIYWQPENWKDFDICKEHKKEIEEFACKIKCFIDFRAFSYLDFWECYKKNDLFKKHIFNVEERYKFSL
ncbi:hypothetical protein EZS27_033393 [termite gut metagenome]|uniref:Uncharacterized protein n=1 Tax=termite gut metagenome TaxID=433724 RepID=A0A5J4Q428_9ZZZZ